MAGSLKARLARIRDAPARRKGAEPGRWSAQLKDSGWIGLEPGLWTRERSFDSGPLAADRTVDTAPYRKKPGSPILPVSSILFFDLETTGLSGGAGTIAFLAGLGRIEDGTIRIRQYFIDDYPGEPAFVGALGREFADAGAIATYNGASFDLPLYRSRCVMNGQSPILTPEGLDLLPAARRLWRRALPDCSLGTIERSILGIDRGEDLPGALVPEAWFQFLRSGPHRDLYLAMDHNASDVGTLARLFLLMAQGFETGEIPQADPVGLSVLLARKDASFAERVLERALRDGCDAAAMPLMRLYWKSGKREERLALAPLLPDDARGLLLKSLFEERSRHDVDAALGYCVRALDVARSSGTASDAVLAERAGRRAARLARLARSGFQSPPDSSVSPS